MMIRLATARGTDTIHVLSTSTRIDGDLARLLILSASLGGLLVRVSAASSHLRRALSAALLALAGNGNRFKRFTVLFLPPNTGLKPRCEWENQRARHHR